MKMEKENIGLYFGSFNPIHIGHLILASYILQNSDLDKIWFVVSAQNPLKKQKTLADNNTRFHLVQLAVENNDNFYACNIEFSLYTPSYTINTLKHLKEKYPNKIFSIIMGQDNLCTFDKWKSYKEILSKYNIYVYPRENCKPSKFEKNKNVYFVDAPLINISATYIRNQISKGQSVQYLVPEAVQDEIERSSLYR